MNVLKTCVFSVALYASETWTLPKNDLRRIDDFEMKYYRRLLRMKSYDHATNEESLRRVKPGISIRQMVIKCEMGLFGHICWKDDDRLVKHALFSRVDSKNKRGRPRREWLDDLMEWSDVGCQALVEATRDREQWSKITKIVMDTNGCSAHGDY